MGVRAAAIITAALIVGGCSDGGSGGTTPTTAVPGPVSEALAELPAPRTEVAGAALGGRIVVVGGLTADGGASDRVDLYDPAANRWEPGPALPLGLHHVGMAALGDRVWVAGGYSNPPGQDWVAQSRVLSLGAGDKAWKEEPALAGARGALALAGAGGRLVAMGGVNTLGQFQRKTEVFTPGQRAWVGGPQMTQPREHLAAAASGGRVYAIGGRLGSLESNQKGAESWDPTSRTEWRVEPELNDARGGTAAAEAGGRPCVVGGEEVKATIASIECLAEGQWERAATLRVPRHGLAVVRLGDRLHVIGGGTQPGLTVSGAHEAFTLG